MLDNNTKKERSLIFLKHLKWWRCLNLKPLESCESFPNANGNTTGSCCCLLHWIDTEGGVDLCTSSNLYTDDPPKIEVDEDNNTLHHRSTMIPYIHVVEMSLLPLANSPAEVGTNTCTSTLTWWMTPNLPTCSPFCHFHVILLTKMGTKLLMNGLWPEFRKPMQVQFLVEHHVPSSSIHSPSISTIFGNKQVHPSYEIFNLYFSYRRRWLLSAALY